MARGRPDFVIVGAGFYGVGLRTLVAEWLLDGRKPELLEPFGLARFASP